MFKPIGGALLKTKLKNLKKGKTCSSEWLGDYRPWSIKSSVNQNRIVFDDCCHYLPLDGIVNMPIYLVWGPWLGNGSTFLCDNRYFEIQT